MYNSDLKNNEWAIIKPYIEKSTKIGRPANINRRKIVDAIFYLNRTGCQWRMLPKDFPNYKTVLHYYSRWVANGTWKKVQQELVSKCRIAMGKKRVTPTIGIIDSQSVKNVQKSDAKGFDAGKKIKGIKRHIVTDMNGLMLSVNVHSAGIQDRDGARQTLLQAKGDYPSLQQFFADSAYGGKLQIWCFLQTKVFLSIVKRKSKEFKILPMRWVVERTFGWINYYRRLSKHYEHTCKSAKAQIEIAAIRLMVRRLANIMT